MKKKLLLSSPTGAPGPMTALRNHQSILASHFDVDLIPLEDLVLPTYLQAKAYRTLLYKVCKRARFVLSVDEIAPYGDNVIFGTFHPVHESIVKKLNRLNIRPSFMWCSTFGQMELTPLEMQLFMRLVELVKRGNIKHLFLHRRLFNSIGHFVKEVHLLPHSIDLVPYKDLQKLEMDGFNVDLFCRPRPGKNILSQIAGFKMADVGGRLHINFDIKQFRGIVEEIASDVIQHKWIPEGEYLRLIAGMRLSLQVTIGESFNYAVCERMGLGVPVLTTKDIYLIAEDHFLAKHLCVEAPDTPSAIAGAIRNISCDQRLRTDIAEACRLRIAAVAKENNRLVVDRLKQCFA